MKMKMIILTKLFIFRLYFEQKSISKSSIGVKRQWGVCHFGIQFFMTHLQLRYWYEVKVLGLFIFQVIVRKLNAF